MSSEKIDLIYEILKDYIKDSNDRMGRIESDLKFHIEGVVQNRTRIEALEKQENELENKVEKLEEPRKALALIKQWAGWVTAVGAAAAFIAKYLGAF